MKSSLTLIKALFSAIALSLLLGNAARADTTPTLFKSFAGNVNFVGTEHTLRTADNTVNACSLVNNATTSAGSDPTSASVTIPSGATIEAAYLYWAGSGSTPDYDVTFDGNAISADTNRRYTANFGGAGFFSEVADVTSIVAAKGTGTQTFSFSGLTVSDNYWTYCSNQTVLGGWSLLIIYSAPSEDFRVLNLYEGFQQYQNSSITLNLTNFQIPSTFTSGKVAYITWEGDDTLGGTAESYSFNNGNTTIDLNQGTTAENNPYNSASTIDGDSHSYGVDFDAYTLTSPDIFAGETTASSIYSSGQDLVFLSAEVLSVPNSPTTDLSVTLAHNGTFVKGQNGSYNVAVTNNGPMDEPGPITVTDTLPAGLTYVSGSGTNWSCSASGPSVTCSYTGTLANGATTPALTLTVAVAANAPSSITNSVHATGTLFDNVPANNTASDTFTFEADLGITMTNSGNFSVGQNSTFTITVNNNGPLDEPGPITVVDNLPGGLSLISFSGTNWSCSGTTTLTCTYTGTLANGATAPALTLTVRPTSSGSFTNSATVTGTQDSNSANNTATNTVGVQIGAYAYYAMEDGSWSGAGGEVKDGSGNGHNGTSVGSAAITTQQNNDVGYICTGGNFPLADASTTYAVNTGVSESSIGDVGTIDFWYKSNVAWNAGYGSYQTDRTLFDASGPNAQFSLVEDTDGYLDFQVDTIRNNNSTPTAPNTYWAGAYSDAAYTWVHIAVTWDIGNRSAEIYRNGTRVASIRLAHNRAATYGTLYIGDSNSSGYLVNYNTGSSANGIIDEARLYNSVLTQSQIQADMDASHPCASSVPDHLYIVGSSSNGITCAPTTLTIYACADSAAIDPGCNNQFTSGVSGTMTATTVSGTPTVNWSGGSGFTIPTGSGFINKDVQVTTVGTVAFGASGSGATNATTCNIGGMGNCNFSASNAGFLISVPNHVADAGSTLTLQAVRTSDNSAQCVPAFQDQPKTVNLQCSYNDPGSGTYSVLIDGTSLACGTGGANLSLYFDATGTARNPGNTSALPTLQYADVGKIKIDAAYTGTSGTEAGLTMTGNGSFVTKPDHFDLTAIQQTASPNLANPAATATGNPWDFPVFVKAGELFSVTATAKNANGGTTPNFGKESTQETVTLASNLISPPPSTSHNPTITGGGNASVTGAFAQGAFNNGQATANFAWDEVGVITLTPTLTSGNYLNAFSGTAGAVSGFISPDVGRFYAAKFTVVPTATAACGGTFTYAGLATAGSAKTGQPFTVSGTVTAEGEDETVSPATVFTTQNYANNFDKLTPQANYGFTWSPVVSSGAAGTLSVPLDPFTMIKGVGAFTTNTATYALTAEGPPQTMRVQATATDSDGVPGNGTDPTAIPYLFGRLVLGNVNGSELSSLAMPIQTQYYGTNGYQPNDNSSASYQDTCTSTAFSAAGDLQLTNPDTGGGAAQTGTTTMTIGAGSTTPTLILMTQPNDLLYTLDFSAPGAGHTGYVDVQTLLSTDFPWLLSNWGGDTTFGTNPSARVTFGVFQGNPKDIYLRELY